MQRPYNIIWQIFLSPISGNSNEDLHENWITGVLRMHNIFEIVHIICLLYVVRCIQSTDGVANPTHAWTDIEGLLYMCLQMTCWAGNNNSVKIPGSWCDFNNMPRFFWLHNRLWVSVGPSLIRLHVPEWANLTPDWPQSAATKCHAKGSV